MVIKLTQTSKFKGNICGKPQVISSPVGCRIPIPKCTERQ